MPTSNNVEMANMNQGRETGTSPAPSRSSNNKKKKDSWPGSTSTSIRHDSATSGVVLGTSYPIYDPDNTSQSYQHFRRQSYRQSYQFKSVQEKESPFRRWLDSFRRDPGRRIAPPDFVAHAATDEEDEYCDAEDSGERRRRYYFDLHAANVNTANTLLSRELKGRHMQMIAIGGSIGTGLFVASGKSLSTGGPASLLIAYGFVGVMLYCTIQALGELAVTFPVAGSFSAYSTRFLDPAWGFAMGWNYALQWLTVLPLEIIAASITVGYWNSDIPRSVFITIFLLAILIINLFGVKIYGEAEFTFALVKITAVIGFILLGIVINIGGTPTSGYIGGTYWRDPGAFHNGFKGLCAVFVTAAFAFTGTELVGLAAAEAVNPRKSLPTAIKQVFWRITLFYVVSLTLIGLLVPYNHPRLLHSSNPLSSGSGDNSYSSASPFVIAIESAGITVLPAVMNSVILVAVLSVGNSAVFGSSRTLAALADQGQAPRILGYVDRRGRPLVAIFVAGAVGLLGYLAAGLPPRQADVLDWLLAVSALSSIFTWGSICLAHIRFRKAWAYHKKKLSDLAFVSQVGVIGSWVGLLLNVLVLVAQFWIAAWPITSDGTVVKKPGQAVLSTADKGIMQAATAGVGEQAGMSASEVVQNFFLQYLCAPIVGAFYLGYKLWYRTSIVKIEDIDIETGRRDFKLPILIAHERAERRAWPTWKKVYKFLC